MTTEPARGGNRGFDGAIWSRILCPYLCLRLYSAELRTMTHSLRKCLLRTTAVFSLLGLVTAGYSQDEPANPADPSAESPVAVGVPLAVAEEVEGKTIYNVPILKPLWETQAVLNTSRDKISHIAMDEEVVFVQSSAGVVTAINSESGRRFWSAQVGRSDEVAMKATSDSQMVAVVVGPILHAFDKFSGQKLFAFRLPNSASASPLITRREITIGNEIDILRGIFIPLADDSFVAYDVQNLQYLGSHGTLKKDVARAVEWRFAGGEAITLGPVAGQERLAFATDAGNIHVVDMNGVKKGETRFQFLMNSRTTAPLTIAARDDYEYLLAACSNNRLFCIALRTPGMDPEGQGDGSMVWTVPLSRPVSEPITVVGNDVFIVASDGEMLKFNLANGQPALVTDGAIGIASQTEGGFGELPAYGAAVEIRSSGLLAHRPLQVVNRSTGQTVNSVVVNLTKSAQKISFAASDENVPFVRVSESSKSITGLKNIKLSDDRKSLTIDFTDFNPGEVFEFYADIEHVEIPSWKLTHKALVGSELRALVSPVRASVVASKANQVEPFPPRSIIGRFTEVSHPWRVSGVKSLVSVSENAVYYVDINDRVVSVSRKRAGNPVVTPTRDYSIQINNNLTDRVYLSTTSGRVACFTESRIELGILPLVAGGGFSWLLYPMNELAPEFAVYHQNPGQRPISTDVPRKDPALPAASGDAAAEMP